VALKIELEFRNVGFLGEGKTGVPGKIPLRARTRTNNKLNPHMAQSLGIEPGPHCPPKIGGRRVLSPLPHPCLETAPRLPGDYRKESWLSILKP